LSDSQFQRSADAAPTESTNPRTRHIDQLDPRGLVELLVGEDAAVQSAVERARPELTAAVTCIEQRLRAGGRWFNLGAGTSGRIGVLDAAEIPPTFGFDPERVVGLIAGGSRALESAVEGAEDRPELARADLEARVLRAEDAVVALSASGRTPYALGALEAGRDAGAATIAITCAAGSALASLAQIAIVLEVGPEVIAGSTRMKGGLAQKQALHTLSTAVMVRLGRTWGNRMSHQATSNQKLRERAARTLSQHVGCSLDAARAALEAAGGSLERAAEQLQSQR